MQFLATRFGAFFLAVILAIPAFSQCPGPPASCPTCVQDNPLFIVGLLDETCTGAADGELIFNNILDFMGTGWTYPLTFEFHPGNGCFGVPAQSGTINGAGAATPPGSNELANLSDGDQFTLVVYDGVRYAYQLYTISIATNGPNAAMLSPTTGSACGGTTATLMVTEGGGGDAWGTTDSVRWYHDGVQVAGPNPVLSNPTYDATTAGTYHATVGNGCVATSNTATISTTTSGVGPDLLASSCGITLANLSQYWFHEGAANATRYRYEISDGAGFLEEVYSLSPYPTVKWFSFSFVSGIQFGSTYNVRVAALVNGCWTEYGNACAITTPAVIPTTQLTGAYCNGSLSSLNQYFFVVPVAGAQRYAYEISDGATVDTVLSLGSYPGANWFSFVFANNIQFGTTYTIRVRVQVGGVWSAFGPACTLATPAMPVPQLAAASCGVTLGSVSQFIYAVNIPNSQRYQYEVSDGAGFTEYGFSYWAAPTSTWFSLAFVPGIQTSTTYDVKVRTKQNGSWGSYGPACSVTTGVNKRNTNVDAALTAQHQRPLSVFPNPTAGAVNLALPQWEQVESPLYIELLDVTGKVVGSWQQPAAPLVQLQLGDGASPGMYLLRVRTEHNMWSAKRLVVE